MIIRVVCSPPQYRSALMPPLGWGYRYLFDKLVVYILIFSTAGPVLNSNLQLYLDINFFFAFSVIEFPVLLGILRPIILACLILTAESLNNGLFNVASTCSIAC